jgi:hypothetical protein
MASKIDIIKEISCRRANCPKQVYARGLCKSHYGVSQTREYRANHPEYRERQRKYAIERNRRIRYEVLSHYSGEQPKCLICGFSDIRALVIDHIYDDGAEERRLLGTGDKKNCTSTMFYLSIIKRNFPNRYQVLCHNCNIIKKVEYMKRD